MEASVEKQALSKPFSDKCSLPVSGNNGTQGKKEAKIQEVKKGLNSNQKGDRTPPSLDAEDASKTNLHDGPTTMEPHAKKAYQKHSPLKIELRTSRLTV